MNLTPKQIEVLNAFKSFRESHGYCPTFAELGEVLKMAPNSVSRMFMQQLIPKGEVVQILPRKYPRRFGLPGESLPEVAPCPQAQDVKRTKPGVAHEVTLKRGNKLATIRLQYDPVELEKLGIGVSDDNMQRRASAAASAIGGLNADVMHVRSFNVPDLVAS